MEIFDHSLSTDLAGKRLVSGNAGDCPRTAKGLISIPGIEPGLSGPFPKWSVRIGDQAKLKTYGGIPDFEGRARRELLVAARPAMAKNGLAGRVEDDQSAIQTAKCAFDGLR